MTISMGEIFRFFLLLKGKRSTEIGTQVGALKTLRFGYFWLIGRVSGDA